MTRTEKVGIDRPQGPQQDSQSVILNLFQELLGGTASTSKRFRTKFGMTETKVGIDRL